MHAEIVRMTNMEVDLKIVQDDNMHVLQWRRRLLHDEVLLDGKTQATSYGLFGREKVFGLVFGRDENGNGGTDHGHGNTMWVLGGGVRGGKIYGDWPGLSEANQHESRDLAITTDFRDVLMSLLAQQFGLNDSALAQVFPEHQQQNRIALL